MNQPDYYKISEEIGAELNQYLLDFYHSMETPVFDKIIEGNFVEALYEDYILKRKLKVKKGHVRANWVYIAAKILLGKEITIKELLPSMAAIELCMWSSYTYNWILDNKNIGTKDPKQRMSDLITLGYLMHHDILKLPLQDSTKLFIFDTWFSNSALGYASENFTRFKDFNTMTENNFWKMDNSVGGFTNGTLYQMCFEIITREFDPSENQDLFKGKKENIFKICYQNGLHLQAINNASDFMIPNKEITTAEKIAGEDYMKDIISDRMTEPTYKLLKIAQDTDPDLFNEVVTAANTGEYVNKDLPMKVHAFLKQHSIIKEIIEWLKNEQKRLHKDISKISKNFDLDNPHVKEGFGLWKQAVNINTHNKFIKQLKIDYEI